MPQSRGSLVRQVIEGAKKERQPQRQTRPRLTKRAPYVSSTRSLSHVARIQLQAVGSSSIWPVVLTSEVSGLTALTKTSLTELSDYLIFRYGEDQRNRSGSKLVERSESSPVPT